jgi:hypothetical protein
MLRLTPPTLHCNSSIFLPHPPLPYTDAFLGETQVSPLPFPEKEIENREMKYGI